MIRRTRKALATACLNAAALAGGWLLAGAAHAGPTATSTVPLVTPEGVTLQPLGKAQGYDLGKETASLIARDQIAYADLRGMTLYLSAQDPPGKSACEGECAAQFKPFLASPHAKVFGAWSVIKRRDGQTQWALGGKPLYTYVKDVDPGSFAGDSPADIGAPRRNGAGVMVGGGNRGDLKREKADSTLPEGWKAAMLFPVEGVALPPDVLIKEVPDAAAFAFTDRNGHTLYGLPERDLKSAQDCAARCGDWRPLKAPQLAERAGDFVPVDRNDGVRQWSYQHRLLFTYARDLAPGFATGEGVDPRWSIAAVARYYMPPSVRVQPTPGQGNVLATSAGMTLYRRDGYILQSGGGHSLRRGQPARPAVGRDLGTDPRCGTGCESQWHPFLAPKDAQPWGFWSVATRSDGNKQWVYQGYALWTYARDQKPGDMTGHDSWDIVVSDDPNHLVDVGTPMDGSAGLWWSIVPP